MIGGPITRKWRWAPLHDLEHVTRNTSASQCLKGRFEKRFSHSFRLCQVLLHSPLPVTSTPTRQLGAATEREYGETWETLNTLDAELTNSGTDDQSL